MPISRVEVHPSCGRNLKGPRFVDTVGDDSGKGYVRSERRTPNLRKIVGRSVRQKLAQIAWFGVGGGPCVNGV